MITSFYYFEQRGYLIQYIDKLPVDINFLKPSSDMSTAAITPIPHIAVGQSVKDWWRRYIAATATLKDEEKKAMIPAYVHRTDGEVLIAENCSKSDNQQPLMNWSL